MDWYMTEAAFWGIEVFHQYQARRGEISSHTVDEVIEAVGNFISMAYELEDMKLSKIY